MTELKRTRTSSCIIVSDNHGEDTPLWDLVSLYQDEVDFFLHCGDSEAEISDPIWEKMDSVRGNMDGQTPFPVVRTETLGDKKIFATHGHLQGVKRSLEDLKEEAEEEKADIVCFGHTHIPFCQQINGVLYINPGSISLPKGRTPQKSYVRLTVQKAAYKVEYYTENHTHIETFTFLFK